ncbi:phosphatidylserine decarboxylase [Natronosporangium hydrolyticum]|nr:phosphatidylserine decarboxylase [Natronosporangium hydrolyticum]
MNESALGQPDPPDRPGLLGALRAATIGARAARALVHELARRPGPKTALLVGVGPDSPVLTAAIDALLPEDSLAVVATDPPAMRTHIAAQGSWVRDRVQVLAATTAADPADVVVIAEPLTGEADAARETLTELAKLVTAGGVLTAATVALPGLAVGAAAELDRHAALYGVGSDLVLWNAPPVRIHRLRWAAADPGAAERLTATDRPSSVPLTRELHIDSNGVAAAGITLGLAALAKLARPRSRLWLLPAAATLPIAAFFRDPQRDLPDDDGSLVIAASDGKVLSVEHVSDDRFSPDGATVDYLRIAVFLSVLDVHVNRAPVAGQVVDYQLEDGGYAPAMNAEAEHNVAAYTVLDTGPRGRVVVAQRTGLLARRIVQRAPVGAQLARGERFGLIRFGSRTDVYLPAEGVEPLVAPDDRVLGGTTPIARFRR